MKPSPIRKFLLKCQLRGNTKKKVYEKDILKSKGPK